MLSHKVALEIIGATASEVGVFILWQVLGIIPSWSAYVLFFGLILAWLIIYFVFKQKQFPEMRLEKQGNVLPIGQKSEAFSTEIFPTKGLRQGDPITFRVRRTGLFEDVYLQGEMMLHDGKWISFPNSKTLSGSGWFLRGTLNGSYNGELIEWPGAIPEAITPGEYTFRIRGYRRARYGYWVWFKLHGLLFLKENGIIRSIDKKVLDYHEFKQVHQGKDHKVIISS